MELTFYPDAHPETSSVDGLVNHDIQEEGAGPLTWAELRAKPGTGAAPSTNSDAGILIHAFSAFNGDEFWSYLERTILLFDTSGLPDSCVITGAVLSVYGVGKNDGLNINPNINVYASNPASDTDLVAGDFDSLGSTPFCDTPIAYADWDVAGYNDFILNEAGLAAISKTGRTKLGLRNANYDVAGTTPSWIAYQSSQIRGHVAEEGVGFKPKLVVTYTVDAPTVTIQAVTNISETTATGNGNVTDLGGASVTQHGHCWNTTGTPTTADSKTENGAKDTTGAFTSAITGLTAGTKYYVRAYATNAGGTSYSSQVEFWADKGTVFPDDPLRRVSGIKRSFWAGLGGQSVYQVELALGGISTTYVSPIGSRDPVGAVTPTPLPSGLGYQYSDYQAWLNSFASYEPIMIIFGGHMPSYMEWVLWKQKQPT